METNYWDKKAPDYDNHRKKSENAYSKLMGLIKKECSKSQTFLDIGTGTGEIPIALSNSVKEITAIDFSQEMINIAKLKREKLDINNITFQVQDCYNPSFNDKTFDIITVINLLHLLDKPEQFLNSVKGLLEDNGKLIIPTFLHNHSILTKMFSRVAKLKGHPIVTRFDSKSIIEFITKCGYSLDKSVFIKGAIPILFVVVSKK